VDVKLLENAKVFAVQLATIAGVKPNDFIGVGAMPQPDGSQKVANRIINDWERRKMISRSSGYYCIENKD
jgi:hypothetical protein